MRRHAASPGSHCCPAPACPRHMARGPPKPAHRLQSARPPPRSLHCCVQRDRELRAEGPHPRDLLPQDHAAQPHQPGSFQQHAVWQSAPGGGPSLWKPADRVLHTSRGRVARCTPVPTCRVPTPHAPCPRPALLQYMGQGGSMDSLSNLDLSYNKFTVRSARLHRLLRTCMICMHISALVRLLSVIWPAARGSRSCRPPRLFRTAQQPPASAPARPFTCQR